jgi:DnaK suppressor protein
MNREEGQLERVGEDNFGHCLRCGEPIQIKRLLFMPESTKCIKCARRG